MIDYQQIFNSLSIPCLLLEPVEENFVVRDVTSGYCEITGRKKEDLEGCVIPGIFLQDPEKPEDDPQMFIDLLRKTRDTGNTHRLGACPYDIFNPVTGKNEKRYWAVENIPIPNEKNTGIKYILHTVFDKTSEVLATEDPSVSEPLKSAPAEDQKENQPLEEEKYKTLIKEAFDLVAVLDKEGNIKFVSESSKKVLGLSAEELVGKYAFEQVHPDDKERVERDFKRIFDRDVACINPYRYPDTGGNYKWFETHMRNLLKDPAFEGVVFNTREVTDLVNINSELEELSERYKLVVSASGDLIYEWNLETNEVKRFFKGRERHFGYREKDLEKITQWGENIHPEEIEGLKTFLKNTLKNPDRDQIRSQYRFKRKDGTYAHVLDRAQIIRNEEGEAIRLVGATLDISSIIERKNALKVANKRFSYAMKATQEMIWDWDILNNSIDRSETFEKIIGPEANDLPSPDYSWYELVSPKDQKRVKASLDKALADQEVSMWSEEYEIHPRNAKKAYVTDRAYIIRDAEGKAIRMVGATLDVTRSREMLKAIETQNKALKEIAWEQAHIVRAPLARIKALLDFIDDPLNREMEQEEILQHIKDSANELDNIVTKIVRRTEDVEV